MAKKLCGVVAGVRKRVGRARQRGRRRARRGDGHGGGSRPPILSERSVPVALRCRRKGRRGARRGRPVPPSPHCAEAPRQPLREVFRGSTTVRGDLEGASRRTSASRLGEASQTASTTPAKALRPGPRFTIDTTRRTLVAALRGGSSVPQRCLPRESSRGLAGRLDELLKPLRRGPTGRLYDVRRRLPRRPQIDQRDHSANACRGPPGVVPSVPQGCLPPESSERSRSAPRRAPRMPSTESSHHPSTSLRSLLHRGLRWTVGLPAEQTSRHPAEGSWRTSPGGVSGLPPGGR